VKAFLSDQHDGGGDPEPRVAPPSQDLSQHQREARALALAGDVDGLVSLVAQERLQGISLARTFDRIFAPAMADIGEGWAEGRVSAAQEHIASAAVGDMLARVRPLIERTSRAERGRALCACLGGEQHDLAIRMVALVLAAEGYRTALLGANVPAGDLALLIAADPPAILALSASAHANPDALRGDLAVVASAAAASRTRLILGGIGFAAMTNLPGNATRYASLEDIAASAQAATG
jgi:methanogenic corrinoid protein MtbC1